MAVWGALSRRAQRFISHLLPSSSLLPSTLSTLYQRPCEHAAPQKAAFCTINRRPGDWDCPTCNRWNFGWRDTCQRCDDPRPRTGPGSRPEDGGGGGGGGGSRGYGYGGQDVKPGDWHCNCGAHNFASRTACFRCGEPKDEGIARVGGDEEGGYQTGGRFSRGGDFGYRSSYSPGSSRSGFKSGDWICSRDGCNEHNFASRMECFKCQAPREETNY